MHITVFWKVTRTKHEVLRAVNMHITVFWKVTPCSLVFGYQRSGQNCSHPLPDTLQDSSGRLLRNVDTHCNVFAKAACYKQLH